MLEITYLEMFMYAAVAAIGLCAGKFIVDLIVAFVLAFLMLITGEKCISREEARVEKVVAAIRELKVK